MTIQSYVMTHGWRKKNFQAEKKFFQAEKWQCCDLNEEKKNASSQKWKKNTIFIHVGTRQKDKSEKDNNKINSTHKADENRKRRDCMCIDRNYSRL